MKRPKPKNLSDVVDKVDKTGHDLVNQVMGKVEKEWDGKPDGYRGLIHAIHADDPEHMKMVLGLRSSCPCAPVSASRAAEPTPEPACAAQPLHSLSTG